MANRSIVIAGASAESSQTFLQALTDAGGTATTQIPGQPIKFNLKDAGKRGWQDWRYFTYEGTAVLSNQPDAATRIDLMIACPPSYILYAGGCALVGLLIALLLIPGFGLLLWLIALFGVGWAIYQATSVYPDELLDRIVSRIPGIITISSTPSAPVPPGAVPTAPVSPPPVSNGNAVADQLKKLAELHTAGVLTDAEFTAKKAELLKRL